MYKEYSMYMEQKLKKIKLWSQGLQVSMLFKKKIWGFIILLNWSKVANKITDLEEYVFEAFPASEVP